jgi:hypothetical protein
MIWIEYAIWAGYAVQFEYHTYLPSHLATYLSTYLRTYLPTYLRIYLPTYVNIYLKRVACEIQKF